MDRTPNLGLSLPTFKDPADERETANDNRIIDLVVTNKVDIDLFITEIDEKVDKVRGKELSTNDYTTTDKNLVATISNKANIANAPIVSNFPIAAPWEHVQEGWNSFYTKDALGNVTLSITCYLPSITMTANEMYLLFTVPMGYRPRAAMSATTFASQKDNLRLYASPAYGEIDTQGRVHVKPLEGGKNTILFDVTYNVMVV